MARIMCFVALIGLFILCKTIPSLGTANERENGRNEFYRSNSDGDVTLEDEQEDHTIEEELQKLGHLHGYFKSNEAHHGETEKTFKQSQSSAVIPTMEDKEIILVSTLTGRLHALRRVSGEVLWTLDRGPTVRAPEPNKQPETAAFLPDPSDGSLYMLGGPGRDTLRKLPFTVPELVSAAPCRSSDGLLYTGKKVDGWMALDWMTGQIQEELTSEGSSRSCPVNSPQTVFIGRTEYTVSMHDSKSSGRRWNLTYTQFSALEMPPELREKYPMNHFTTTSSGRLMAFSRDTGTHLWQTDLDSPVVGVYALAFDGLYLVPHTTVATETMRALTHDVVEARELVPTLYIGEHKHGLYALPSLVDSSTVHVITSQSRRPLIDGPREPGQSADANGGSSQSGSYFKLHDETETPKQLQIGFYDVPNVSRSEQLTPLNPGPGERSRPGAESPSQGARPNTYLPHAWTEAATQTEPQPARGWRWLWTQVRTLNTTFLLSPPEWASLLDDTLSSSSAGGGAERAWFVVAVLALAALLVTLLRWKDQTRTPPSWPSGPGSGSALGSRGSSGSRSSQRQATAECEQLDGGVVRVGKISFDSEECIGKGCEGTFVYKGWFDGRDVAVKRLLPDCFTFADREVALLRESDQHPNVIRYFCMEQDRQFRYIALELCIANVQDYVLGRYGGPEISGIEVLKQATAGLKHLHHLNIVHRDIKPHNVLLAARSSGGAVAMISDFGLCKKLSRGRASFSRRSGVAGTEGWIAPEMADGEGRATCAVDVFSLGCVFYYVLSGGHHPFGESFRRQYNILSGEFCLSAVDDITATSLIRRMVSAEPDQRPTVAAVLSHPTFWSPQGVLHFFQDVSDRIEKELPDAELVRRLERRGWEVTGGNWRERIDSFILDDLGKFRSYRPSSVRDLLRALRNKRNHYRELNEEARRALGTIPEEFVRYWTSRFPRLLAHVWSAAQEVRDEPIFSRYYCDQYDWTLEPDPSAVPPWRRSPAPGGSPSQSPSPRRRGAGRRGGGRGGRTPDSAVREERGPMLVGSQPGMSLIGALLESDAREKSPDGREAQGAQSDEVGARVRQRLIDIVQESGVVVEDAANIVRRASRTDLAADGGATFTEPAATGGATYTETPQDGGGLWIQTGKVKDSEGPRSGDVIGPKPAAGGGVASGDVTMDP
ncbi:serine/threonine-protein kinase/endoribonuclease IRE1-like [Amphibalanus amphitrite]|uniref:serine/threonine-protein kinase/endoribonuclease IRE1-like n=1 Tax=Amphibalanus amphitrite TaxID=1232801 RepID=UPI001C8FB747|nr:serine/threonine-protein kinase/endoribonuclease IRE1-like [Amphibalanus amphitrite]XP_043198901.1 serine/threonine-protein kinase/endoribonuclease IRE1-like [Amphibalanus amphitrite]XP_043198902.1 serine/threonine-protein kinase/endoribonuclease IRE1-like [Amphibalanus amphitrite]XP_043198903.1 serine/threonine-protein kinase/endoribonuclease IRE1-like [Amphibalanus amphitrite]